MGDKLAEAVVVADHLLVTHRTLFFQTEDGGQVKTRRERAVIIHRAGAGANWGLS